MAARSPRARNRTRAALRRLAAAEALTNVGTFDTWHTRAGRCIDCSPQVLRIYGFAPEAPPVSLAPFLERVHPDDRPAVEAAVEQSLGTGAPFDLRHRILRPDGTQRSVRVHGEADQLQRRRSGLHRRAIGRYALHAAIADVTESEQTATRLITAESLYGAIVEHANDGVWIVNRAGVTSFVNSRLGEMLGYSPSEMLGRPPSDFSDGELPDLREERRSHFECRFVRKDGRELWTANALSQLPEKHGGDVLLLVTDITEHKLLEERLRQAAELDALTGLLNRTRFEMLLDRQLAAARSSGEPVSLLFVDLDHFKFVNDTFGHSVGDALVREVADRLAELTREGDVVARFGADEFVIALPGMGRELATAVAHRLLDAIREHRWQSLSRITASIGLAIAEPGRETTRAELMVAADNGLHEAKSNGRNQVAVYSGEGRGAFHWVDELRAALHEGRLVLHSQPIVSLIDNHAADRQELLLRMRGRDGRLISPCTFIPAAEQFGLMNDIDRWVVKQAVALASHGMALEINLSGTSLGDAEICRIVERAVREGVAPDLLTFEVTETAAARNIDKAREFALELEALGCRFALDDFGTGFGSLVYLKHLPVSQIKIDTEFIRELTSSEAEQRLVSAIVQMASPLGLETVAEGVEDAQTLTLLRRLGVHFAQGFYIGRPAPIAMRPLSRAAGAGSE